MSTESTCPAGRWREGSHPQTYWDRFQLLATGCEISSVAEARHQPSGHPHTRPAARPAPSVATGWSHCDRTETRRVGTARLRSGTRGYEREMDMDGDDNGIFYEPVG